MAGYNTGDVAVHEAGHYFGLYHTWEDCGGDDGDKVADTVPHKNSEGACIMLGCRTGVLDTTQVAVSRTLHSFMNTVGDACRNSFTSGQQDRMEFMLQQYRPTLVANPSGTMLTFSSSHTIPAGTSLYLMAGTTLRFASGASLTVNGNLSAQGAPGSQVVFSGSNGGNWGGIYVASGSTGSFSYATVENVLSYGGAALRTYDGTLNLTSVTVQGTQGYAEAVSVSGAQATGSFEALTISHSLSTNALSITGDAYAELHNSTITHTGTSSGAAIYTVGLGNLWTVGGGEYVGRNTITGGRYALHAGNDGTITASAPNTFTASIDTVFLRAETYGRVDATGNTFLKPCKGTGLGTVNSPCVRVMQYVGTVGDVLTMSSSTTAGSTEPRSRADLIALLQRDRRSRSADVLLQVQGLAASSGPLREAAREMLAALYVRHGRFEDAAATARALASEPGDAARTSRVRLMEAHALFRLERFAEARQRLSAIPAGTPEAWALRAALDTEAAAHGLAPEDASARTSTGPASESTTPLTVSVHPNPAQGVATVRFILGEAAEVRVAVFDVLGREVARLLETRMEAGTHAAMFDGSTLPRGTYVVRVAAGGVAQALPLVLAR